MHYVYVLESSNGELYFGSTSDLKKRLGEHETGKSQATRGRALHLIYYEAYLAESDARLRESRLKHHGQAIRQVKDRLKGSRLKKS